MAKKKKSVKPVKKGAKKAAPRATQKPAKKTAAKKTTAKKTTTPKAAKKSPVKATAKKTVAQKTVAKKLAKSSVPKSAKPVAVDWSRLLTPLDDRLVIRIDENEKMTPGGLYIPDTATVSGNNKGTVLAIGRGHKNKKGQVRPMDVKPGDQVLFDQYAGSKMTLAGTDIRILRESEVLGIVE